MNIINYPTLSNLGLKKIINPNYHDVRYSFKIPVGHMNDADIAELLARYRQELLPSGNLWFPARGHNIEPLTIPSDIWVPTRNPRIEYGDLSSMGYNNFNTDTQPQYKRKYPSYCCKTCGEPIGWLGRFFQWLPFKIFKQKCNFESSNFI